MTERALLIGSSYSAAPILFAMKRRGLHVTVCGSVSDDPCHRLADASCFLDYSDQEALLDHAMGQRYDFLVPSCNDFSYVSGSYVADRLGGFSGFDLHQTTMLLHTKHRFRAYCEKIDLPSPKVLFRGRAAEANLNAEAEAYPLLVKPTDSFSGRGVTRVSAPEQLAGAVSSAAAASRAGEIVVEAFEDGSLHSHSAFIEDGAIFWDAFVDEFCVAYPYQVDCSNYPSRLPAEVRAHVRAAIQKLIERTGLCDGLLHTQFIAHGHNIAIIECMRRGPGDLYGQLIERATAAPHYDWYVAKFLGEGYKPAPADLGKNIARHTISVRESIQAVGGFRLNAMAGEVSFVPLKTSAQELGVAPFDKLGILFVEFAELSEMLQTTPRFGDFVELERLERLYG